MTEIFFDVLKNSVLITGLVIVMMIMIEYVNVQSGGRWFSRLQGNSFMQVILASLLGMVPGCIGGFAAVSLYTHRLISFGALVAMMICSSGDEAFVMLAMIPRQAVVIFSVLFVIAVISGTVVDMIFRKKRRMAISQCGLDFDIHKEECGASLFRLSSFRNLKSAGREKIFILCFIGLFSGAIISGILEHDHDAHAHDAGYHEETIVAGNGTCQDTCIHEEDTAHIHAHGINILNERWLNLVFAALGIITLLLTVTASEHFVKSHLWNHVVKKHMLSIFLWTFGALFIIQTGMLYFDMEGLLRENMFAVLVIAVLIGFIPESGPHMVFISLFSGGLVPVSVLVANSIVQDGHTALPLLAESKKDFFMAKAINMLVGFFTGGMMMLFGL